MLWDRWVKRKINLKLLSERLQNFFETRKFRSLVEERSKKEYWVIAVPDRSSMNRQIFESIRIRISGDPDDFKVEFLAGESSRNLSRLGMLVTLFGGGVFLSRSLKLSEELEKLEREFWRFADEAVDSLQNSEPGS